MNMQQGVLPKSSSNGYGHHIIERDTETNFNSIGESVQSGSRDRLIYLTSCLIGHQVEVQVTDGSVFSGIFHSISGEDYGVILKMANSVKNCSQGQQSISDSLATAPSQTLIIPAKELVQVIGKDVPVVRDGFTNELQREKQQELMTDSYISQSRNVEGGRELERWVPDEDDLGCPELENIFDGQWNRGWDQFEVNKNLFGVKSTFDEELYTTKLKRGPQTRELEREALRIAREIEGEQTLDLHLAEERGVHVDGNIEMDEETRFSSVLRPNDDSRYGEIVDTVLDSRNDETFGDFPGSVISKTSKDANRGENTVGAEVSLKSLLTGEKLSSLTAISMGAHHLAITYPQEEEEIRVAKAEDSNSLNNERSPKVGLSPNATAFDPSRPEAKETAGSLARTSSSASSASDRGGATSTSAGRGLSPSSSVASLSSEKSTLNPHAKEFKLSANAKSFVPFQPPRPSSPAADNSFYYPPSMPAAPHMHGMPAGVGVGPSFAAQQPVMFNPQAAAMQQPFYHPNGPQYGQQMPIGQPRPVYYMPPYPHEMQYK